MSILTKVLVFFCREDAMVVIFRTCHSLSHPFSSSCLVYSFFSFLLTWGKRYKFTNFIIVFKGFLTIQAINVFLFFNFFYLVFDWGILNITLGSLFSLHFLFVFEAVGILLQDEKVDSGERQYCKRNGIWDAPKIYFFDLSFILCMS